VRVAQLPIRLPFSPYAQIAALISMAAIAIGTFYVQGLQYSVASFALFLLAITVFYRILNRRNGGKPKDSSEQGFAMTRTDSP
jgi:amino acid transporter, AAT family